MKNKRYLEIYEKVKDDIIAGRYKKNSKIPSKRIMAENSGVSIITIEHAYELLIEEGYIASREKSGYFVVFDDKELYVNKKGAKKDNRKGISEDRDNYFTKVEENNNQINSELIATGKQISNVKKAPSFPDSIYAKTVRRVLSEYGHRVMDKSPKNGMVELRTEIAEYLNRSRRLEVSPDQIIVGAGAEYLYGLIVQTFGANIIYGVESPSYQKITKVYKAGGANVLMLKLSSDGIISDELWNGDMKVLHITPYRSFPSGVTASAAKKREYLKWSRQRDGYIIEDDFESEFTPSRKPEETIFSLDGEGRVLYVNTFTRTIGSFVRAAYMVLPENLLELFNEKIGFYECPVPTMEQLTIAELLKGGDFERHINRVRRYNRIH